MMSTFQIVMLTIVGTLLFVYVVFVLLMIHENNRSMKELEERLKASRRITKKEDEK